MHARKLACIGELFIMFPNDDIFLRFSGANTMRLSFCKHFVNVGNDYVVTQKM